MTAAGGFHLARTIDSWPLAMWVRHGSGTLATGPLIFCCRWLLPTWFAVPSVHGSRRWQQTSPRLGRPTRQNGHSMVASIMVVPSRVWRSVGMASNWSLSVETEPHGSGSEQGGQRGIGTKLAASITTTK